MTGKPLAERLLAKIEAESPDECWSWLGFIDKQGYGRIRLGGRETSVGYAHRTSYEVHVGAIPEGLHLDHLCRNRSCVNPSHLEPVPSRVNFLRGVHNSARTVAEDRCKRGHEFSENAYVWPRTGKRSCRECRRVRRTAGAA